MERQYIATNVRDVIVDVDEARQDGFAGDVPYGCVGWYLFCPDGTHGNDAAVVYQNLGVLDDFVAVHGDGAGAA